MSSTLAKRIIPCLDIKDGQTVKGINFEDLIQAGDPVTLAKRYATEGADELVLLDITATQEGRSTFLATVTQVAKVINIPFTVGGGINSVAQVSRLLEAGADKISINSAAIRKPELIETLAKEFGSQCIVVAIDTKNQNGQDFVFSQGGKIKEELETYNWALQCWNNGAGEILLTSMDADGTKNGFDLKITAKVSSKVSIPVIASGGAGKMEHFDAVFAEGKADAALAASIFHFNEISIPSLKSHLHQNGIQVRL